MSDPGGYDVDYGAAGSTGASPPPATADDTPPPDARASKEATAPEAPRWRFVNEAKGSLGYSSWDAGIHVPGRSSEELGAKYVAPDVSLYRPKKDEAEVHKLDHRVPSNESPRREDVEVGRLSGGAPPWEAFSIPGKEVGRLTIQEAEPSETQRPSGVFAGLPEFESPASESRNPFREWEPSLKLGPKKGREHEWWDGEVSDLYRIPGDDPQSKKRGEVGRIKFHVPGDGDESFGGEIPKRDRVREEYGGGFSDTDGHGDPREGILFINNAGSTGAFEIGSSDSTLTELVDGEHEMKKRRCLFLLLLIPLLLGMVLGLLLGRESGDEAAVARAMVVGLIAPIVATNKTTAPSYYPSFSPSWESGDEKVVVGATEGGLIPVIFAVDETTTPSSYPSVSPSNQHSSTPSLSPSLECPVGKEAFSIIQLHHSEHILPQITGGATWKIKDACSGEVIAQCDPCPKGLFTSSRPGSSLSQSPNDGPTRRFEENPLEQIVECLPINSEYSLEVIATEDPDACCGFDPTNSIVSYGNVVVKDWASDGTFDNNSNIYFGEGEMPCASESPSASPSNFQEPEPACSTKREFNLCIAVDMSGSVCNDGSGSDCLECKTSFLPMIFTSQCRDSFVSEDSCCNNFANVKEFSSNMVSLLGDFPAEKSFSIVQFATKAERVSGLSSVARTLPIIDQLDYTGGLTNHAGAIQACQRTLPTPGNRKNFIMLITDGMSSEPELDPEGAAEDAATSVKNDGIFIIPVFISPDNDWSALSFMRRLSSDGKVFDVTHFASLNDLQDRLVDQVSCSGAMGDGWIPPNMLESPTASPSNFQASKPTCSTEQEFNLCVAVDMSGSVCNDGSSSECLECKASFLPMIFTSECRDSFVSEDNCCNNFVNVKKFSSNMVSLLGDFPAQKSFSIVQFATNAKRVSGLSSVAQTLPIIDQLDYTGGLTNHASAIQACEQTLPTSGNRKNFIMLITDGMSSEPGFDPEGAAEDAATSAKNDGIFIIPVFISPNNDRAALSFMRRLSSDGKVFDVTDFASLNGLQDKLVDQVSCSGAMGGSWIPPITPESPTAPPSNIQASKPGCSTKREFNLCVAVDMSGSVCNDGSGSDCLECKASFLPMIFTSQCRDSFVSKDSCCANFANVKQFSSNMVSLLGDFPAEKSFSIVQFATKAELVSGLSSVAQTLPIIDQLDYTGGLTNHASAIQACQQTLPISGNRKNFIMLITDGMSSEPGFDPEDAAEDAATSAKNDGIFIIPVFISPSNDWSALSFMRRLSSDGKVFDVTDFASLNGLQDRLVDQVSCS